MLLRATKTFLAFTKDGQKFIAKGTIVDSSDPVVTHRADLFAPVEATYASAAPAPAAVVEQATAAPGEVRAVKKAAARKSAKG
jgi:hypothetical protein